MGKKVWLVALMLVGLLVVALGTTSVLAQGEQQTVPSGNSWAGAPAHCSAMMNSGITDQVTLKRVAGILGLTYDELIARLNRGETIAQVAEAQKVALTLVVDTIVAPETEMIQVQVKYGYLTQAQAQSTLEQIRYWAEQAVTSQASAYSQTTGPATGYNQPYGSGYGGMMGGWQGQGGMMGGGRGGMMGRWGW